MPGHDSPAQHEDLYAELMEGADRTGQFVIETEEGRPDIDLTVEAADKPTRNKLRRNMPDGLLDGIELPDDVESADDISPEDVDLSEVSISDMTFSEEATNVWLDTIADQFNHNYYSQTEVREIFGRLDDEFFISAGSYLIELGASTGPVEGFRRE